MESFIKKLTVVKAGLPANCTQANLARLHSCFTEYRQIIESMPVSFQPPKNQYQINCGLLEQVISGISNPSNSLRDTKYYFKSAVQQLANEIDQQIAMVSEKICKAM